MATKGFRVIRQTGWFSCDRCRVEGDEPVFELMSEIGASVGWHYNCRACALKRVDAKALASVVSKQAETREKLREARGQKVAQEGDA